MMMHTSYEAPHYAVFSGIMPVFKQPQSVLFP